jgi:uncharacterized membrane protein
MLVVLRRFRRTALAVCRATIRPFDAATGRFLQEAQRFLTVGVLGHCRGQNGWAQLTAMMMGHGIEEEKGIMKQQIGKSFGFLKTTALGGIVFLLPLAVVSALLGYVYNTVVVIYEPLKAHIPVSSATGLAILFLIAVAILLAICFFAGLLARRAIGRKFSRTIEKQLTMVYPKYAIYKDLLAGNIGGAEHLPSLKPVCVRFDDSRRLAFESDRLSDGLVSVYLPGAPDTWNGTVILVEQERVEGVDMPFGEVLGICERLGRDSARLLSAERPS